VKVLQRIKKNILATLVIVWFFSISGCRDFKDYRTPYKSFVKVAFQPINKGDKLTITTITNTATRKNLITHPFGNKLGCISSLDPNADSVQLDIDTSPASAPKKLIIYYQREAVLISHQCGCAYKYIIKEVKSTSGIKHKILNKELSTLNDSDIDVQIYL